MKSYIHLGNELLENGQEVKHERTGKECLTDTGYVWKVNVSKYFPLLTTKKMEFKNICHELIWMLSGSENIKYLRRNRVKIWNDWADKNHEVGPIYGYQWAHMDPKGHQIKLMIENIKKDPTSRRHLVTAWNPEDIPQMALPPCDRDWET